MKRGFELTVIILNVSHLCVPKVSFEEHSFNVVIGVLQGALLIPFTFRLLHLFELSPLTKTHFSSLEIHSVKAEK